MTKLRLKKTTTGSVTPSVVILIPFKLKFWTTLMFVASFSNNSGLFVAIYLPLWVKEASINS